MNNSTILFEDNYYIIENVINNSEKNNIKNSILIYAKCKNDKGEPVEPILLESFSYLHEMYSFLEHLFLKTNIDI
jgi:hypothetical protein